MAVIKENFGEGGANLVPEGAQGSPTLAEVLRDIADDLAMLKAAIDQLRQCYNHSHHIRFEDAEGVI